MSLLFIYTLSLLLGLTVGSFLNVVIFRTEKDKKLTGRSYCPKCKKKILWYDNIPLVSFLLLGGRCRFCRKTISAQYPLVEMLTGLVFLAVTYLVINNILNDWLGHYFGIVGLASLLQNFGLAASLSSLDFFLKILELLFLWAVFSVFIAIFVYDRKHMLIPDSFSLVGIIVTLFYAITSGILLAFSVLSSGNQNRILDAAMLEKKQTILDYIPINVSSFFALSQETFYSKMVHLKSFFPASQNLITDTSASYADQPSQFIYSLAINSHLGSGLVAGVVAALLFFLIVYLSHETWMGMGDVKLVFFLGLFLGIFKSTVALFLAFEIGALVGIYLMLSGRAKMKTALPFGPFLILGAVLSLMLV
jgi:prepilin signal peptidase PulO-like enzyme (type II secretory pathway)